MTLHDGVEMTDQVLWNMIVWANDPGNYYPNEGPDPWDTYSAIADARPSFNGWLNWNFNERDVVLASTPDRLARNA